MQDLINRPPNLKIYKTMKMLKINILIIMSIIFCNASCEKIVDHGYYLKVQNNTNDTIWCYASYSYPDTSLTEDKPLLQMMEPMSYTKLESKEEWEDVLSKDTICIFILSNDTVDKYSWEEIRSHYNILKRYDLSLDDLKQMNYTIIYP